MKWNPVFLNFLLTSLQFGDTLLYIACREHPSSVSYLITRGAKINSRSKVPFHSSKFAEFLQRGRCPLHIASIMGRVETARDLLIHGARLHCRDNVSIHASSFKVDGYCRTATRLSISLVIWEWYHFSSIGVPALKYGIWYWPCDSLPWF